MEYVKTQLQLQNKAINPTFKGIKQCITYTIKNNGILGLYRGCPAVLIGAIPRYGSRFGTFNLVGHKVQDNNAKRYGGEHSKRSMIQNLLTGICAGIVETTIATTPQETIKTKLIHSNKGFIEGSLSILKNEGILGFYRGWSATTLKHASNLGLRFMAFNLYKEKLFEYKDTKAAQKTSNQHNQRLTAKEAFLGGMISGTFSTVCNNPFDMMKTRMQSIDAQSQYKHIGQCFSEILRNEGILAFWQGLGARLLRVVPGQGILLMSFEKVSQGLNSR